MKQYYCLKIALLFSTVFLLFIACRNEDLPVNHEKHEHSEANKYVSFATFISVTKLSKQSIYSPESTVAKNTSIEDFDIDTVQIRQTLRNNEVKAYSFLIYPKNSEGELKNVFYNLAYIKKADQSWEKHIVKYTSQDAHFLAHLELNPTLNFQGTTEIINQNDGDGRLMLCAYTSTQTIWNCPQNHSSLADCLENGGNLSCCTPCKSQGPVTVVQNCTAGSESGGFPQIPPGEAGGGGNGDGGGSEFDVNLPLHNPKAGNPCAKMQLPTARFNSLFKNADIAPQVNQMINHGQNSNVEYGFTITQASPSSPYVATAPYTDNNPGNVTISIPSAGSYVASGHNHNNGGAAPPSIADLYNSLGDAVNHPNFKGHFIFSKNGTVFSLVVTDRVAAAAFLTTYPQSTNFNEKSKLFNDNSEMGREFLKIYNNFTEGRNPNYSGFDQNDAIETSISYILEKYGAGIALAKNDAVGNLKAMKAVPFQYIIPSSGGKVITAYKSETCP